MQAVNVSQLWCQYDRVDSITHLGMQVRTRDIQVNIVSGSITGTRRGTTETVSGAKIKWQGTGREVGTGSCTEVFIVTQFHANAEIDRAADDVQCFDADEADRQNSGAQDAHETAGCGNQVHEGVGQAAGIQVQRVTGRITRSTHDRGITVDHDGRSRLGQDVECVVVVTAGDKGASGRGQ